MKIRNLILFLLAALMMLSLAACTPTEPDGGSEGGNDKIMYNIKVVDYLGNPKENIVVDIMLGEELAARKMTNNAGVVKASESSALAKGTYTLVLKDLSDKPFYYDADSCVLTADKQNLTITLYDVLSDDRKDSLFFGFDGADLPDQAHIISDGGYRVELSEGANFLVFTPSRRGIYEICADGADISYLGSPHFVQGGNLADTNTDAEVYTKDGKLYLKIRSYNVGDGYGTSSRYVIGLGADAAKDVIVKVTCDPNLAQNIEELPWEEYFITGNQTSYTLPVLDVDNVWLKNVDIFDDNTTIVYNNSDKYYHYGNENGPIVLIKLTEASDYLPSLSEMMETAPYSAYIYGDDGKFVAKRNYDNMMASYFALADKEFGVYPLTKEVEQMLIDIGTTRGWYEPNGMNNIFLEDASRVSEKNAHLFACCYFDGEYMTGSTTEPFGLSEAGSLAVSDAEVYISYIYDATVTITGESGTFMVKVGDGEYETAYGMIVVTVKAGETITVVTASADYTVLGYTATMNMG